ncbi:MAG: HAD-IA family hydrolase [Prevotellaceae bacterium]|nr:HAD-IA family hydrolase [Prevotellaceae bacterium]
MRNKVVIFDLDDTLYNEVDYVEGKKLKPYMGVELTLQKLIDMGYKLGMITNGDMSTQKSKLKKLKLNKIFNSQNIIIPSKEEDMKPATGMYERVVAENPNAEYYYVGNNLEKDFLPANKLGWVTICMLDNGLHIHKQDFTLPKEYLPKFTIHGISEILKLIENE